MDHDDLDTRAWGGVLVRSLLVGAVTGLLGGALIFFSFGFIGFSGASFATRVRNGWDAVVDVGLSKGLLFGVGIALGLAITTVIWGFITAVEPLQARPWLAMMAGLIVIGFNLESLRNARGWDVAGLATVFGMALVVGAIVWVVSPWVLRDVPGGRQELSE